VWTSCKYLGVTSTTLTKKVKIVKAENVEYVIVFTKDSRVRLDSICALSKEISSEYLTVSFKTDNTFYKFN